MNAETFIHIWCLRGTPAGHKNANRRMLNTLRGRFAGDVGALTALRNAELSITGAAAGSGG